jgi:hypothetical protein
MTDGDTSSNISSWLWKRKKRRKGQQSLSHCDLHISSINMFPQLPESGLDKGRGRVFPPGDIFRRPESVVVCTECDINHYEVGEKKGNSYHVSFKKLKQQR